MTVEQLKSFLEDVEDDAEVLIDNGVLAVEADAIDYKNTMGIDPQIIIK